MSERITDLVETTTKNAYGGDQLILSVQELCAISNIFCFWYYQGYHLKKNCHRQNIKNNQSWKKILHLFNGRREL